MNFKLGIDVSAVQEGFKDHSFRGIGRYAFELQNRLSNLKSSINISYFRHNQISIPKWLDDILSKIPYGKVTIRQQIFVPLFLGTRARKQFDLIHFLAQTDAPSWCTMPYIITVHDIIPLVLSDLYKANKPSWRFNFARYLEKKAIKNAKHIVTISQNSAADLTRVLGVAPSQITVIPNGVDEKFFQPPKKSRLDICVELRLPVDRQIVLYVGGIDPRKNSIGLISIFEDTCSRCLEEGKSLPILVIAGKIKVDSEYPRLEEKISNSQFKTEIFLTDYISDEDLISLLHASSVFAFPSLYEGFGLTPLEACAAGVAVVSSNRSSMPEVLEDGAILCDPKDIERFSNYIFSLLNDESLRSSYKERGPSQARKFSWDQTAEKLVQLYEKLSKQ